MLATNPTPTKPVTLNLFQGPFRPTTGAWVRNPNRGLDSYPASTALAARWTLKQVQGDEAESGVLRG